MTDRNDEPPYPIDAIALLKTDHRKVKNLFARYESAGDFTTKHLIAEQVFPELAAARATGRERLLPGV